MSKHPHEPDNPQQSDRTRQAPATGGDPNDQPNRTANTSLTNPGLPPGGGMDRQGAARGDQDTLPNRTANTSLTNPGPPQSAEGSGTSQGAGPSGGYTGPSSGNVPNSDDMIPWDPTGKIDDEVERRYRKPPTTPQPPPATATPQPPPGRATPPGGAAGPSVPAPAPPGQAVQPGSDPGWDATEQPPAGDPGWDTAPPSGTLPRDPGDGSSGDYSGPITSAPADRGQGGARTMQDVRSAPVPAHGARDARPPANGGGTDAAPTETPNKAPKKAPHTRSQRDTSGYGEVH